MDLINYHTVLNAHTMFYTKFQLSKPENKCDKISYMTLCKNTCIYKVSGELDVDVRTT